VKCVVNTTVIIEMEKRMVKLSNTADENVLRSWARRQGFKLRRDGGDRYSLIDERTAQIAFEGSAVGSLDDNEVCLCKSSFSPTSGTILG
jgi:hypothetical protein